MQRLYEVRMRAGKLRQRIILQSPTTTQNEFGDEIITYATAATVWAKVETTTGDEDVTAQRAEAWLQHTVTIRNYPGVLPTWRVVWGERTMEIAAIIPDNVGREMQLVCSETI
jgi:SPP1 family predicted phage head-tail adaptor